MPCFTILGKNELRNVFSVRFKVLAIISQVQKSSKHTSNIACTNKSGFILFEFLTCSTILLAGEFLTFCMVKFLWVKLLWDKLLWDKLLWDKLLWDKLLWDSSITC